MIVGLFYHEVGLFSLFTKSPCSRETPLRCSIHTHTHTHTHTHYICNTHTHTHTHTHTLYMYRRSSDAHHLTGMQMVVGKKKKPLTSSDLYWPICSLVGLFVGLLWHSFDTWHNVRGPQPWRNHNYWTSTAQTFRKRSLWSHSRRVYIFNLMNMYILIIYIHIYIYIYIYISVYIHI
jgi:hypothetical protein